MSEQVKLFCCDWGTSAFRLTLVDSLTGRVLASDQTNQGIASTYEQWQRGEHSVKKRNAFYLNYMQSRINVLEQQMNLSLNEVPLIVSGMASSSMGMDELPYKTLPFLIDGSDLIVKNFGDMRSATRKVFLISGVKSEDHDVMRGEETLLVGSADEAPDAENSWFIFPGTHAKHIHVEGGIAKEMRTFMTGEFFELLVKHSILAFSVSKNGGLNEGRNKDFFEQGVLKGIHSNLLNSSFSVRTNRLFNSCNEKENYYFLSGLLIGSELSALPREDANIILVCGAALGPLYEAALKIAQTDGRKLSCRFLSAEEALIRGQLKIHAFINQSQ